MILYTSYTIMYPGVFIWYHIWFATITIYCSCSPACSWL